MDLSELIEALDAALTESEGFQEKIDRLGELEEATSAVKEEIAQHLNEVEAGVEKIEELTAATEEEVRDAVTSRFEEIAPLRDRLDQLGDVVLTENSLEQMTSLLEAPQEAEEMLAGIEEAGGEAINHAAVMVEEACARLEGLSEDFEERALETCAVIEVAGDKVLEVIETTSEEIGEIMGGFGSSHEGDAEGLIALARERLLQELDEKINEGTRSIMDALDTLDGFGGDTFEKLGEHLEKVASTFDEVIEILEPIKPVLEQAAAIT